ncbi:MAG TPA: hypothetical protein VHW01_13280 [Polyangiaceae bacterium]|jgi:hypothetical protein|nr:hypothetical protein [Polyangiaceae bacterium]
MCNLIELDPKVKVIALRVALECEQTMRERDDAPVFRLIERVRRQRLQKPGDSILHRAAQVSL